MEQNTSRFSRDRDRDLTRVETTVRILEADIRVTESEIRELPKNYVTRNEYRQLLALLSGISVIMITSTVLILIEVFK